MTNRKRKSLLAIILTFVIIAAQLITSQSLVYAANIFSTSNVSGGVSITKYLGPNVDLLEIPSYINGQKVVSIGNLAFRQSKAFNKVKIPNTVTTIGVSAFQETNLTEVLIPSSVSSIGMMAFYKCEKLEKVSLLYGVNSIGDSAFGYCTNLTSIDISDTVTQINYKFLTRSPAVTINANPDSAAGNFTSQDTYTTAQIANLPDESMAAYEYEVIADENGNEEITIVNYKGTSLTPIIPEQINYTSVTAVGDSAFEETKITQITFPSTLKTIGTNAFIGTNLTLVEVPDSVTSIGKGAFEDVETLIIIGGSAVDNYIKENNITKITFKPYSEGHSIFQTITITKEGNGTLAGATTKQYRKGSTINLVAIPNSGSYFDSWELTCASSNSEYIGEIANPANRETTYTVPLTLMNSSADIVIKAIFKAQAIENIVINNGVVQKYYQPTGDTIVIPATWKQSSSSDEVVPTTSIARYYIDPINYNYYNTFSGSNIKTIEIPSTVTSIAENTFNNLANLENIIVHQANTAYKSVDGVLYTADLKTLIYYPRGKTAKKFDSIPASVNKIENYAFYYSRVEEVELPTSITSIGDYAFYGSNLTSIPSLKNTSVSSIGGSAFANTPLTSIALPDTITTIGGYAFQSSQLASFEIPKNYTTFDANILRYCYNMEVITIHPQNTSYVKEFDVLLSSDKTILYYCPPKALAEEFIVPGKAQVIMDYAFANTYNLKKVTFENNSELTAILNNAFECSGLEKIELPETLEVISSYVFNANQSLREVNFPKSLKIIDTCAFQSCDLREVNIPASVTSIGWCIFDNNINLESIVVEDGNANYYNGKNDDGTSDGVLYSDTNLIIYPPAKLDKEYVILPQTTYLSYHSFANTKYLNEVIFELPDEGSQASDVSYIEHSAFYNSAITSITLPSKLTQVNSWIFQDAKNLTKVEFPSNITYIGSYILYGADNVKTIVIHNPEAVLEDWMLDNSGAETVEGWLGSTAEAHVYYSHVATSIGVKFKPLDKITEGLVIENGVLKDFNPEADEVYQETKQLVLSADIEQTSLHTIASDALREIEVSSIKMPMSLKKIEPYAFHEISTLETINIPRSVSEIGALAFYGSKDLKAINVAPENANYSSIDGVLVNDSAKTIMQVPAAFVGDNGFYSIPDSVNGIESSAFIGVTGIIGLEFKNIETIGTNAFKNAIVAPSQIALKLGEQVAEINNSAFEGCTGITSVDIAQNLERIGYAAFAGCVNINAFNVDESNKWYSSNKDGVLYTKGKEVLLQAPGKCSNNAANNALNGVKEIYSFAFYGNTNIKEITIPESVVKIGDSAFALCNNLFNVSLPETLAIIGNKSFWGCDSLIKITIPKNIKSIDVDAFTNCQNLFAVTVLSKDVLYNTSAAYDSKTGNMILETKKGTGSTTDIKVFDEKQMNGKPTLTLISSKGSTTEDYVNGNFDGINRSPYITFCEFSNNDGSEYSISVDETVVNGVIEAGVYLADETTEKASKGSLIFLYITPNEGYHYKENSLKVVTDSNELVEINLIGNMFLMPACNIIVSAQFESDFAIDSSGLITYMGEGGKVTIPTVINGINVVGIANNAFSQGKAQLVTEVTIPSNILTIGDSAFENCKDLRTVKFEGESSLTTIGNSAFAGCSSLSEIEIPQMVTSIGDSAFEDNISLSSAILPTELITIGKRAFYNCKKLTNVGSEQLVLELPENAVTINEYAFFGCELFTKIKIPASVETIGNNAFEKCSRASEIYIANGSQINVIGLYAFLNCYYNPCFYVENSLIKQLLLDCESNIVVDQVVVEIVEADDESIEQYVNESAEDEISELAEDEVNESVEDETVEQESNDIPNLI